MERELKAVLDASQRERYAHVVSRVQLSHTRPLDVPS